MGMMYPWQMDLLDKMTKYQGKGFVQVTGRNMGKSTLSSSAFQRLWNDLHARPVEDLKLSEGTVYGSRYYTVEPVGGNWPEMELWCIEHFDNAGSSIWGEKTPEPAQRWYTNNRKFWFRDEMDRMIFVLRWR
jgi:hypothetical protein